MSLRDPEHLLALCRREIAEYAAGRKAEVDKGRETPEFAALLVQKYGYGMIKTLELLARSEDSANHDGDFARCVDNAVASINPDWAATDRQRWAAKQVGISMVEDNSTVLNLVGRQGLIAAESGCLAAPFKVFGEKDQFTRFAASPPGKSMSLFLGNFPEGTSPESVRVIDVGRDYRHKWRHLAPKNLKKKIMRRARNRARYLRRMKLLKGV